VTLQDIANRTTPALAWVGSQSPHAAERNGKATGLAVPDLTPFEQMQAQR
jgi:hypothetical protein